MKVGLQKSLVQKQQKQKVEDLLKPTIDHGFRFVLPLIFALLLKSIVSKPTFQNSLLHFLKAWPQKVLPQKQQQQQQQQLQQGLLKPSIDQGL